MAQADSTIEVSRTGRVVTVTLDRPRALNALDPRMLEELLDVVGGLARDETVNGLVLTGRGRRDASSAATSLKAICASRVASSRVRR